MTDKYAVIGNPISHSKSPLIHKMFAQQTAQDISYVALESPLDGFAKTLQRLRAEGYKGCNVTVPFKLEAYALAGELSERAKSAQAVNTLLIQADRLTGDNTDGIGLVTDIRKNLGCELRGKRVLLMGAGGAARGVARPLLSAGAQLIISNRSMHKAEQLLAELATLGNMQASSYTDLAGEQFDIVINATSSSLTDDMPSLPHGLFKAGALAYDMMYGRQTPFLVFSKAQGASLQADGLGMLVEQAAAAFQLWRGVMPDTAPVIARLRA